MSARRVVGFVAAGAAAALLLTGTARVSRVGNFPGRVVLRGRWVLVSAPGAIGALLMRVLYALIPVFVVAAWARRKVAVWRAGRGWRR